MSNDTDPANDIDSTPDKGYQISKVSSHSKDSNDIDYYKSFIPSALTLLISLFFGYLVNFLYLLFSEDSNSVISDFIQLSNKMMLYPVFMYIVFLFIIIILKSKIKKINSNLEKIKLINKSSGLIDGIGTALPLIGAALILFTVGLGEDYKDLFKNVAIPFEIKSLFLLAIAKLFENVFDQLEIQYIDELPGETAKDKAFAELKLGGEIVKVEIVNVPNPATLAQIISIAKSYETIVSNIQSKDFGNNLDKIKDIIKK